MQVNTVINVLSAGALFVMMVSVGICVTVGDVLCVARDWKLSLRAGLANYALVPAAAVGLLLLLRPAPMVAVGFLVAVVCPGAPFGPPFTGLARGRVTVAVGLMAVLAASSAIVAPVLLHFLLPIVADRGAVTIHSMRIVAALLLNQFLPLCLGLTLRYLNPELAGRLKKPVSLLSSLLNIVLASLVLTVQFKMLQQIRPGGYVGMLAMVTATLLLGWLAGGPGKDQRKTMAISTSTRNVGVALVIAASSFPGTPAISAAIAYALFQTVAVLLIAMLWGFISAGHSPQSKAEILRHDLKF